MNADVGLVFPAVALFSASLVLTAVSLWIGGRLAPWFLKETIEPPTVRSYFLDLWADTNLTKARMVTALIAMAFMLASLLIIAVLMKIGGVSPL